MTLPEIYGLIDRLRRQFPRNLDVLALTDITVNLLAGRMAPVANKANAAPARSRRDYMRNYMRERRNKQRQAHG